MAEKDRIHGVLDSLVLFVVAGEGIDFLLPLGFSARECPSRWKYLPPLPSLFQCVKWGPPNPEIVAIETVIGWIE